MSAFIVSKRHIDFLISAGLLLDPSHKLRWQSPGQEVDGTRERGEPWGPAAVSTYRERVRGLTHETADAVGHMLLTENHRSVNHRYDENDEPDGMYAFEPYKGEIDPVAVLKQIACLDYQSCEHPGWNDSEAKAFLDALTWHAIPELRGYDGASWGID